ncbi:MAG: 4'-phosphopantetheinyl transferase superfamily protein [Niabella sp.]
MTVEEMARGASFKQTIDRERFLLGRLMAKGLIARLEKIRPDDIEVLTGKNGKPFAARGGQRLWTNFNISHSGDFLAIALSYKEVGVDIEQVRNFDFQAILTDTFSANEIEYIQKSENPLSTFFLLWTRKEALLKYAGVGLTDTLPDIQLLEGENDLDMPFLPMESCCQIVSAKGLEGHVISVCCEYIPSQTVIFMRPEASILFS